MPDPTISIPWSDESQTMLDFNRVKVNGELATAILAERDALRARSSALERFICHSGGLVNEAHRSHPERIESLPETQPVNVQENP